MTFAKVNRLDLITGTHDARVVIGSRAHAEVRREPSLSVLAKAVRLQHIHVESVDLGDPREATALALYDGMPAFRGRGEAEVLALVVTRGYVLASDEVAVRDALRVCDANVSFVTSTHILKQAVLEQRISPSDAIALFHTLDIAKGTSALLRRLGLSLEELLRA